MNILKFTGENKVISSSELASAMKVSWNTAEKRLLELALEEKIVRIKKEGVNLWVLKRKARKIFHDKILDIISERQVVSTYELALKLKISWNTAEKRLLELALEGKVKRIKKAGVNLWVL